MNIKPILLSAFTLLIAGSAIAQDKIYKRNGDVLDGKVLEISTRTISYKRADNATGPTYVIDKDAVDRVEYQNGTEESMRGEGRERGQDHAIAKASKVKYG